MSGAPVGAVPSDPMRPRHPHRRHAALVALLALFGAACSGDGPSGDPLAGATDVTIGEPAADLLDRPLDLVDAEDTTLAALVADGPVVVNYWASWCAPCIQEMPEFEEVHQEVGDRVTFVGINVNDRPEDAARMIERTGITYLVARDDGTLARAGGALNMPTTLVLDRNGAIAVNRLGTMSGDDLRAAIEQVLGS
jgi:cytochrome c biogenesis protein CcmG, thiol:disulfide interchange protein DsbE